MRPVTPRGFRDVLFQEAAERGSLAASVRGVFSAWGYREVSTPVVEAARAPRAGMGRSRARRSGCSTSTAGFWRCGPR